MNVFKGTEVYEKIMNIKQQLEELRNAWKNVPNIAVDLEDIKIRRKIIEIRAKMLGWGKPKVDVITSATEDYMKAEWWDK